jgi:hypothetical protein
MRHADPPGFPATRPTCPPPTAHEAISFESDGTGLVRTVPPARTARPRTLRPGIVMTGPSRTARNSRLPLGGLRRLVEAKVLVWIEIHNHIELCDQDSYVSESRIEWMDRIRFDFCARS